MRYLQIRASRPPPVFELRVRTGLAQLAAANAIVLPAPHLSARMSNYIESLLLAENLPPTRHTISMLINTFSQLIALSLTGRPILYRKRDTISLLFDVFSVQSEMNIHDPDDLVLGYTQTMMGFLLFNSMPRNIGMIGLGGGSLTKYCYRYLADSAIAVAEIDPGVIALRDQFRIPPDDDRLSVHCMDGTEFVRLAEGRFDVLLVDGFDKKGQPDQLCSARFYDDCYRALADEGILVINLLGDAGDMQVYSDRIDQAFDGNTIAIKALDSSNKIVFACKGNALDIDTSTLARRFSELQSQHQVGLDFTVESIVRERRSVAREHSSSRRTGCRLPSV